jgi:ABC-type transport system involved in multi-copper enzyme maturation permease subunit
LRGISPSYHWLGAPLLVGEVFTGIIFLGWSLLLIYLFFSKKKSFPGSAIFFMVVSLVLVVIDLVIALMIPALRQVSGTGEMAAIVPGLISAAIWIPYFSKSKRVHATFIE